jgi:hypothetical protein
MSTKLYEESHWVTSEAIQYHESDYHSTVKDSLDRYLGEGKKVVQGKADFKAFLESLNLENFPSEKDFNKIHYRRILASILWQFRKEVLKTYESTLRFKIGKSFTTRKTYTGRSRILPSTFSFNTSKDFPIYWTSVLNEWDTCDIESEGDLLESHLSNLSDVLNVSIKNGSFKESMDFTSLLVVKSSQSEESESQRKERKSNQSFRSLIPIKTENSFLGYVVKITEKGKVLSERFFSTVLAI